MIIPGQQQDLDLQFLPQALSWEATPQMGWSLCGSRVVRWPIGTHLRHQNWSTIQSKRASSQAVLDLKATPHRQIRQICIFPSTQGRDGITLNPLVVVRFYFGFV